MRRACLPAIFVLWAAPLAADTELNCRQIDDDSARLACYDQHFPRPHSVAEPESVAGPEPAAEPEQAEDEPVQTARNATAPATTSAEVAPAERAAQPAAITATVTKVVKPKGRPAVITLSNGQVWSQVSFRYARLREGDTVNIEPSRFGGYILANERGIKMRVRRAR